MRFIAISSIQLECKKKNVYARVCAVVAAAIDRCSRFSNNRFFKKIPRTEFFFLNKTADFFKQKVTSHECLMAFGVFTSSKLSSDLFRRRNDGLEMFHFELEFNLISPVAESPRGNL